jgi:hypothetical protein
VNLLVFGKLYQVMNLLVYPLAVALAFLVTGITRVRPIEALSTITFPDLVENVRMGTALFATIGAAVWISGLLPEPVLDWYLFAHYAKAFGELGMMAWPHLQARLLALWSSTRAQGSQLRDYLRSRGATHALPVEPENEPLLS